MAPFDSVYIALKHTYLIINFAYFFLKVVSLIGAADLSQGACKQMGCPWIDETQEQRFIPFCLPTMAGFSPALPSHPTSAVMMPRPWIADSTDGQRTRHAM